MPSDSSTEKVINSLIDNFIDYVDNGNASPDNVRIILSTFYETESFSRAYPEISQKVYSLSKDKFISLEKFMGLTENSENLFSGFFPKHNLENDSKEANLERLERHITLSCYQREYINNTAQKANDAAEKAVKNSKKAQKKVKSIYSEFVGILGIFTAMSFTMMGSVEILGNLFSDIKKLSSDSLGYAFIVGGVYLIVIYLIILMLFIEIKKLFNDQEYKLDRRFAELLFSVSALFSVAGMVLIFLSK